MPIFHDDDKFICKVCGSIHDEYEDAESCESLPVKPLPFKMQVGTKVKTNLRNVQQMRHPPQNSAEFYIADLRLCKMWMDHTHHYYVAALCALPPRHRDFGTPGTIAYVDVTELWPCDDV